VYSAGVTFWLAAVIGVAFSALIGALTHLLVMRPLRRASPLARTVATLGVLITIQAAAVLKYGSGVTYVPTQLPDQRWSPFGITITIDRLILFGIAAVMSVALWALYRYTKFGLATTACAENQRAASSLGLSPDVIATANWALGSALAGLAAVLIAPIVTLQVGTMTNLVLASFAAALVAAFRSFPIAFAAGMLIGIAQTELDRFATADYLQGVSKSLPFFVVIVFLVLRGQAIPLRDFFLQRLPHVGSGRVRAQYVLLGVLVGAALILTTPDEWVAAFTITLAVAVVLLSIVVVTGYAGQISLAQFAIAGFGAWVAGRLVDAKDFPFWAAVLVAVIATVPLGMLFALPAVRTRGIALAIVTLGLGTALELMLFSNGKYVGGYRGTVVGEPTLFGWNISPFVHSQRYALFCLGCFVVLAVVVANVRRGRTGRRLLAVRTNERAAAALGISVVEAKLYAFALSAAIAAVGGILYAFTTETITYSQTFTSFTSITYVGLAFIGGIGFLMGPIFGATIAPGAVGNQITNSLFSQNAGNYITLVGGIVLILLVIQNQDGIAKETMVQLRWVGSKLPRPGVRLPSLRKAGDRTLLPAVGEVAKVRPQELEVRDLVVRYGAVVAVDGVSLDLKPGHITGLIGPNGAGKTTLIDAVTGFTPIASGTVTLNGEDIRGRSVSRRARDGISRSFQSLELFEDASVLDNLRAASDPRDWISYLRDLVHPVAPQIPDKVAVAIREFQLEDDLSRHVQDLPYGQRRLLAIARAVAIEPSILLLDEPAAGLGDAETRELAHLVRRLADEWGMAVLLIEHDVQFVMSICDHIVVLDFGKQIAEGPPEQIRNDPAVVAAYLGEPESEDEGSVAEPTSSTAEAV
jgi:sulfate-transporting ATPase